MGRCCRTTHLTPLLIDDHFIFFLQHHFVKCFFISLLLSQNCLWISKGPPNKPFFVNLVRKSWQT